MGIAPPSRTFAIAVCHGDSPLKDICHCGMSVFVSILHCAINFEIASLNGYLQGRCLLVLHCAIKVVSPCQPYSLRLAVLVRFTISQPGLALVQVEQGPGPLRELDRVGHCGRRLKGWTLNFMLILSSKNFQSKSHWHLALCKVHFLEFQTV